MNPLVGRWDLNVARSHYGGGAEARRQELFVCEAVNGFLRCTTTSVRIGGRKVVVTFTARDDGTPSPVGGLDDIDEISLTRIDRSIVDATFRLRGQPVFAYRAIRATDGGSLTVVSVDPVSRTVLRSVIVYDAQ